MPRDAQMPFEQNSGGDIKYIDGEEFYRRHALQLALMAAEDTAGDGLTANEILELEDDIRTNIENSPYFELPVSITLAQGPDTVINAQIDVPSLSIFEISIEETDA